MCPAEHVVTEFAPGTSFTRAPERRPTRPGVRHDAVARVGGEAITLTGRDRRLANRGPLDFLEYHQNQINSETEGLRVKERHRCVTID